MRVVRRLLRTAFGFLALIYCSASCFCAANLPKFISQLTDASSSDSVSGSTGVLSKALLVLALLVATLPIPLTALYATAWWTIRQAKRSARSWALAASIVTVLQGIAFVIPFFAYQGQMSVILSEGFIFLLIPPLVVGIPGVIAFAPRGSALTAAAPVPERVQGDGTSRGWDRVALALQVIVFVVAGEVWWRWSQIHQFYSADWIGGSVLWLAELGVVIFIHEAGHIVAGIAGGMKLSGLMLGPFYVYQFDGRWRFHLLRGIAIGAAAGVRMIPSSPERDRIGNLIQIASGPCANLFTGLCFLYCAATIPVGSSNALWGFCSWTGILSLGVFVLNVIPLRSNAFYSDGARIYQILARSVLDDYHWILSFSSSIAVTPNRPRDYDLDALRRVLASDIGRAHRVVFHLMESECLLERGLVEASAQAVANAQASYNHEAEVMTAGSICALVFGHAVLRGDAHAAQAWAEGIANAKGFSEDDRWFCDAALACGDGLEDSMHPVLERFEKFQLQRRLSGSREFNLFLASYMRKNVSRQGQARVATAEVAPADPLLASQPAD
ncbi:MAG: M50 family metallopeptidase [Terracidiphilus sp.]